MKKNGKNIKCIRCNSIFYKTEKSTQKFCSQKCVAVKNKNGFKKGHKGFRKRSLNPKTDESKIWRVRLEYSTWRNMVFARDNWTCKKCKKIGGKIHPHHILNFAQFPEFRFIIDNGITFCEKCHIKFHSIYGRKNNNHSQVNEYIGKELYNINLNTV